MANSPSVASDYPGASAALSATTAASGNYRVVRIHTMVTEAYVNAASPAAAQAAAAALAPQYWKSRKVKQFQPGLEDIFEYDVIASDPATSIFNTDQV